VTAHKAIGGYAAVAGALLCALGLTALLTRPTWSKAPEASTRFLGLDEPVEPMPKGK
jgi:hypothetical protein